MRWMVFLFACSSSGNSGPLYAVASNSSIATVSSLSSGKLQQAIQASDSISLYGVEGSGTVFTTSATTPVITRYQLSEDGALKANGTLDLGAFGVGAGNSARPIVIAGDKKAYFFDDVSLQAIRFDPSSLSAGKAIDLSMLKDASYLTSFSYNVVVRGSKIIAPAYYYNSGRTHEIADSSIAIIDTTDDSASIISDARCGELSTAAVLPNGDLYFGTDPYSVALHRIGGNGAAPDGCLLRMKAGENLLDQGFFETVATLTGGSSGGGAVPGDGNTLWVRAFDESLFSVTATTSAQSLLSAPAWRWWKIDLANPTTATQSSLTPGSGVVRYFMVEGHAWAAIPSQNQSGLFDMSASGAAGIVVDGSLGGIVKLR